MLKENKELLNKGDIIELTITGLTQEGMGVGRHDGLVVFINDSLPQETVEAKIIDIKKGYAIAECLKIINNSINRVKPECKYFDSCGGCTFQHMNYVSQLDYKKNIVKDAIERIAGLNNVNILDTIGMERPYNYRNKAQFPVGKINGKAVSGFFKRGTHNIVDIDTCFIQDEYSNRIKNIVTYFINYYKIPVYNEKTGQGLIRNVMTRVGFSSDEIMVVIVSTTKNIPYIQHLIKLLIDSMPKIKSIIINVNKMKTNVILGEKNYKVYGVDKIKDNIGDLTFSISPHSFFQVNPVQTKKLYDKVLEYAKLDDTQTVYDLYCGAGTISLFLARKCKQVIGVEIVSQAIEDAKENAKLNSISNVNFICGKAEEVVPRLYAEGQEADIVVVDPPRKGCEIEVLETIIKMNPKRIVYVSCKPSTLARDLKYLVENGYSVVEVQPVDMFPWTEHVETVVLITRTDSKEK